MHKSISILLWKETKKKVKYLCIKFKYTKFTFVKSKLEAKFMELQNTVFTANQSGFKADWQDFSRLLCIVRSQI